MYVDLRWSLFVHWPFPSWNYAPEVSSTQYWGWGYPNNYSSDPSRRPLSRTTALYTDPWWWSRTSSVAHLWGWIEGRKVLKITRKNPNLHFNSHYRIAWTKPLDRGRPSMHSQRQSDDRSTQSVLRHWYFRILWVDLELTRRSGERKDWLEKTLKPQPIPSAACWSKRTHSTRLSQ